MKLMGMYVRGWNLGTTSMAGDVIDVRDRLGLDRIIIVVPFPRQESFLKRSSFNEELRRIKESMRKQVELARRSGLRTWFCVATFCEIEDRGVIPALAVKDVEGRVVSPDNRFGFKWRHSLCPSNPSVVQGYEMLVHELAAIPDVEGMTLTHHRYSPIGHNLMNIFSCTCANCTRQASQLGYDMGKMKGELLRFIRSVRNVSSERFDEFVRTGSDSLDLLYQATVYSSIADWIKFRCDLMSETFKRFRTAAKGANNEILFGTDVFPISFSPLVGHNHKELARNSDFLSPLLPHPFIFNLLTIAETVKVVSAWNKKLEKKDLFSLLYRIAGYQHLKLPASLEEVREKGKLNVTDFEDRDFRLSRVVAIDAQKWRSCASSGGRAGGGVPSYGIVGCNRHISPAGVRSRIESIRESGMDGVILQPEGLPIVERNMEAIRLALGDL